MYKIFTSLWSKTLPSKIDNHIQFETETFIDDDDWVFVETKPKYNFDRSTTTTTPPSIITQQFNPIENLLIEHASMSVYEQIAFRTRHQKTFDKLKIDTNEDINDNDDDDDNQTSTVFQYQSQYPIVLLTDQENVNNSSILSNNSHHRHINRIHQRRKRSIENNSHLDKSIYSSNKTFERQRFNFARTPKLVLHQPSRSNH